jgi:hypothetical protein
VLVLANARSHHFRVIFKIRRSRVGEVSAPPSAL